MLVTTRQKVVTQSLRAGFGRQKHTLTLLLECELTLLVVVLVLSSSPVLSSLFIESVNRTVESRPHATTPGRENVFDYSSVNDISLGEDDAPFPCS